MSRPLLARLLILGMAGTMLSPLPAFAKHASSSSSASDSSDPVVARVNGDSIHRSDVTAVLRQITPQGQQPSTADIQKLYPHIIDDLIARKLAYQEAVREGLQNSPEVKHEQAMANQQIVEQAFFAKIGSPAVTDEKLHQAYDEATKTSQEEVHARHILVKTEDEAKDIIKQLDSGDDFQKLAKEKSIDKDNAKDGGDLGFFTKGNLDPAFTDAAFALQPGKYTEAPVKTQFGYDVIQSGRKAPGEAAGLRRSQGPAAVAGSAARHQAAPAGTGQDREDRAV